VIAVSFVIGGVNPSVVYSAYVFGFDVVCIDLEKYYVRAVMGLYLAMVAFGYDGIVHQKYCRKTVHTTLYLFYGRTRFLDVLGRRVPFSIGVSGAGLRSELY